MVIQMRYSFARASRHAAYNLSRHPIIGSTPPTPPPVTVGVAGLCGRQVAQHPSAGHSRAWMHGRARLCHNGLSHPVPTFATWRTPLLDLSGLARRTASSIRPVENARMQVTARRCEPRPPWHHRTCPLPQRPGLSPAFENTPRGHRRQRGGGAGASRTPHPLR